jgi:alpha-glucosidase
MQMMRSSYEGILRNNPKERPFVLTRSGYSGLQRYGAIWTGDNQASDSHMMLGIRLINSLGLSGVGFVAMDIGGFEGQSSKETYTRWIQIGAFMPLMRIHTMIDNRDQEPWALGETTESIARSYIQLRYRLLPYLYAAFEEGHRTGLPIQRSLAISFFNDNRVYDWRYENQFTCANNLLLAPIKGDEYYLKVFFPEIGEGNSWYSLWNDHAFTSGSEQVVEAPLHLLPVFAKAGAVIPMQSVIQHTGETPSQLLEWHIYPITTGESVYEHYEDDGLSYDYKKGKYLKRTIQVNATSVKFSEVEGQFESPFTHYKLVFHGLSFTQVYDDTHTAILHLETHSLIADLPNFNPIGKNIVIPHSTVKTIYVPASNDEFTLSFS